jgi:amino-acid N-acetyltransferase
MALSPVHEPPAPSSSPLLTIPFIPPDDPLPSTSIQTRKAQLQDARSIHQLIHSFTHDGTLLPRRYAEICANIDTFTIAETASHQFIGCASLHVYGQHLAEIRSIAVRPGIQRHGAGGLLVHALLDQAEAKGIKCVCLFTRVPGFFEHFHFQVTERLTFDDKVLKDCMHCARRNACDEIAMAIGELPTSHTMPVSRFHHPRGQANHANLVQLQL